MRTLPHPRTLLVTSAVAAAGTLLAACGSGSSTATDPTGAGTTPSGTASDASPSSGTTSGTPTSSAPASGSALPLYFVGDTPRGPRLFREFQDGGTSSDSLTAAATRLVTGSPADPDYSSALPSDLDITGVRVDGGAIVVTIGADSPVSADKSMDAGTAALAVQQLVYTLDAVSQTRDPLKVVQGDGSSEVPVRLYGQATDTGVEAADPLDVLALVNVTEPEQGSTVSGTLHASGVASSFEGNVPWALHSGGADGPVVKQGAATADGYLDKLYPWSVDVDLGGLPSGSYTFVASTDDASGGEGAGPTTDSKTFTIG